MYRHLATFVLGTVLIGANVGAVSAQPIPPRPIPSMPRGILPPYEIATIIRSLDFEPLGRPMLSGTVYRLRAIDPDDNELHLTIDARNGQIIQARPALLAGRAYPPPYGWRDARGVPMPDESEDFRRPPRVIYGPRNQDDQSRRAPTERKAAPLPRKRPDLAAVPQAQTTAVAPATPPAEPLSKPAEYPVQSFD